MADFHPPMPVAGRGCRWLPVAEDSIPVDNMTPNHPTPLRARITGYPGVSVYRATGFHHMLEAR